MAKRIQGTRMHLTAFAVGVLALCLGSPAMAQPGKNMLPNGGFERGQAGWNWGQPCAPVAEGAHGGSRCLRIAKPAAALSVPVKYPGGRVRVAGWIKLQDVVHGEQRYNKAGLQLISYNAAKRPMGHLDVFLGEGTHDWQFHEATTLLSKTVAYVGVACLIWGSKTTGTAYFDDLELVFLDDPAKLARRPVNLKAATVTVRANRELGPLPRFWEATDNSWSDRALHPAHRRAMRLAHRIGFRFLRLHDIFQNRRVYTEDAQGRPQYDWTGLDEVLDTVLEANLKPILVVQTMPDALGMKSSGGSYTNPVPPKDYAKWQELVRRTVLHCKDKYGEQIHEWYWEVWNEPNASLYFEGTLQDYLKIYDHAVQGAVSADPAIKIGGPGGAGDAWCDDLLEHCAGGTNAATGKKGARIDFLSWHIYCTGVGTPALEKMRLSLQQVRQWRSKYPRFAKLPLFITEWGAASSPQPYLDTPYNAAFTAAALKEMLDQGVALAVQFSLVDGVYHSHGPFSDTLGMVTVDGIPKPNYQVFRLLHQIAGTRVEAGSSNEPVDALAVRSTDGQKLWVLIWNFWEDPREPPFGTKTLLKIKGLPHPPRDCRAQIVDADHGNPRAAWERMGRPEKLTQQQRAALLQAAQLGDPTPVALTTEIEGTISAEMVLPVWSVRLLEFDLAAPR